MTKQYFLICTKRETVKIITLDVYENQIIPRLHFRLLKFPHENNNRPYIDKGLTVSKTSADVFNCSEVTQTSEQNLRGEPTARSGRQIELHVRVPSHSGTKATSKLPLPPFVCVKREEEEEVEEEDVCRRLGGFFINNLI